MRIRVRLSAGIVVVLALVSIRVWALTQDGVGVWTVDGGGGNSSGGSFALHGTAGQPDAGIVKSSGVAPPIEVRGGFWHRAGPAVVGVPDAPALTRHELAAPTPNPFNPQTTLRFDLAHAAHARVQIHDTRGRVVRTLVDEMRVAGAHLLQWHGRSDDGQEVASGVYYVRMVADGQVRTQKMTLVK